jgi:hypothetical protein
MSGCYINVQFFAIICCKIFLSGLNYTTATKAWRLRNIGEHMTHTKDEALKKVLDDLIAEYHMETSSFAKRVNEMFKQALAAQPVQEPVSGVVLRDGLPALLQDKHIKETDQRLYTAAAQPAPVQTWIDCKVQMPPPGVRVFFLHKDYDRVGFDTWFGDDFRWTPSHWMPIPPLTTPPAAQPAPVQPAKAPKEYTMGNWFNDLENPHGNR